MSSSNTSGNSPTTTHWIHPDFASSETAAQQWESVDSLCIGTGRFLRAVLVPLLTRNGTENRCVLVQPRGRSFLEYMAKNARHSGSYEIDTVLRDGSMETSEIPTVAAFSWGNDSDREAFYEHGLPKFVNSLRVVGVGITEAGLASADTPVMQALYEFLCRYKQLRQEHSTNNSSSNKDDDSSSPPKLCLINMDNVPNNGTMLQRHMHTCAAEDSSMRLFLDSYVVFLDTMVDRITSSRQGSDGMVPRAEPVPAKALVILDPHENLPDWFRKQAEEEKKKTDGGDNADDDDDDDDSLGLVIRTSPEQLQADLALKLRIANGTHTALCYVMALSQCTMTDVLARDQTDPFAATLLSYVDSLVADQILPAATDNLKCSPREALAAWEDWRSRLTHAHFGLATFFITQNGAAKGGIRLGPTALHLLLESNRGKDDYDDDAHRTPPLTVTMAYAMAALLRWLTPARTSSQGNQNGVYRGWLPHTTPGTTTVSYADGLRYDFAEGWYEFRCACQVVDVDMNETTRNLADWLAILQQQQYEPSQPASYVAVVRAYLVSPEGGNIGGAAHLPAFDDFCRAIATLYARMVAGDDMWGMLKEMQTSAAPYNKGWATPCSALVEVGSEKSQALMTQVPLHYRPSPVPSYSTLMSKAVSHADMASVVASEVAGVAAIDLHTHLLPPTHGPLCLWGIDELLTYHYLVAEYFITAPADMTPELFYSKTKEEQADLVWKSLFLERSPVSEACRGVITTLVALGLKEEVRSRNLTAIRKFYASYRDKGEEGAADFSDFIFENSGVRYSIMTNIPFDSNETQYWRPEKKDFSTRYRSALRVDPLLAGDRATIEASLKSAGYDVTLEGARQYLRDWCDTMSPEYMMASTPHNFTLSEGSLDNAKGAGINTEAMKEPGAFAKAQSFSDNCSPSVDDAPSLINENSDFLSQVLMKVCEERDLPLALKIGAHRAVNPQLKAAGDGMVAFADANVLARLCSKFPKVRFLATFLSRNNQHEACVLASKFRNLHLYGCWWYCNNPSIIAEITKMRVEMLGTACTLQHSDARVLDQLLYKWSHSRGVIASVLQAEYAKLALSGWGPTRAEIRRDVERLFGGSYEEFMEKSLI